MNLPPATSATREIAITEPVPTLLRDLVHERTGVYFEPDRFGTMLEKLEPRARVLGCQSYLDYYYVLKYDANAPAEWRRVMDAFSVQETYFWREYDQIRTLVERVVPEWFRHHDAPLRIWSAACASGEEPYSIAMALQEAGWGAHPIEILASDASEAALARARAATYRDRSFRVLPPALKEKYFAPRGEDQVLSPAITARVNFRWANLMKLDELPEAAGLQVIFCRNVFIYFSLDAIKRVVASFAARLPANGKLFIGASESLLKLTTQFELRETGGAFVYQRNPEPVPLAIP
jgi:chemotaxis protein methyltransferase CheR